MCWKLSYPSPQRAYCYAADYRRRHRHAAMTQRAYHCSVCYQWHLTTVHVKSRQATLPAIEWED